MDETQNVERLALTATQVAEQLGVSLRHIRRSDCRGLLPKPCRIGRSVRWPVATIQAWLAAGAPDRRTFEQLQGQRKRRAG